MTAVPDVDAPWFLRLADTGYAPDDGSAAFFPLYPLLVRAVGTLLGGSWLLAAYVVVFPTGLFLFALFWCLARVAERRRVHDAVVAVSAAGLGVCSLLVVNGYDVL